MVRKSDRNGICPASISGTLDRDLVTLSRVTPRLRASTSLSVQVQQSKASYCDGHELWNLGVGRAPKGSSFLRTPMGLPSTVSLRKARDAPIQGAHPVKTWITLFLWESFCANGADGFWLAMKIKLPLHIADKEERLTWKSLEEHRSRLIFLKKSPVTWRGFC